MNDRRNLTIIALGDSITQGYPYGIKASWVNILNTEKGFNIINKGINGDTLEGMLERFQRDVVELQAEMVIIMGGTNDAFIGFSLESMQYNIKEMVKKAMNLKIIPVIGIPIPTDEPFVERKLNRFRDFLKKFCEDRKISYIDFYKVMVNVDGLIKKELDFDGVHPNMEGYRVMAVEAYNSLMKVLNNI